MDVPWAWSGLTGAGPERRAHSWPWCKRHWWSPAADFWSWPLGPFLVAPYQVRLWFPCGGKTPRPRPAGSTGPGCASMSRPRTFVLLPGCPGRTGVAPVQPRSTVLSSFKSLLKGHLCHDSCRKTDSAEAAPAPRPPLLH